MESNMEIQAEKTLAEQIADGMQFWLSVAKSRNTYSNYVHIDLVFDGQPAELAIYLRKLNLPKIGVRYVIANISAPYKDSCEHAQKKGILKHIVDVLKAHDNCQQVVVECLFNRHLRNSLLAKGWELLHTEVEVSDDFYDRNGKGGWCAPCTLVLTRDKF